MCSSRPSSSCGILWERRLPPAPHNFGPNSQSHTVPQVLALLVLGLVLLSCCQLTAPTATPVSTNLRNATLAFLGILFGCLYMPMRMNLVARAWLEGHTMTLPLATFLIRPAVTAAAEGGRDAQQGGGGGSGTASAGAAAGVRPALAAASRQIALGPALFHCPLASLHPTNLAS